MENNFIASLLLPALRTRAPLLEGLHAENTTCYRLFHGTNEGPLVAQTLEMLQNAARMKKVRDGDFRPCLLRIPALYVVAVWLISEDGPEADVIIPMDPCHRALKPGRSYSREQLHKRLQKPARESLEYHSRPQPEP